MIINREALDDIQKSLKAIFLEAFLGATPRWPKLAMRVPSNAKIELYKFLSEVAKMRKWVGERELTNLKAYQFQIENLDWELTIPIDRNDILFDSLGLYTPLTQMMGVSAAEHPDDLLTDLLIKGGSSLCYDGQYFFDDDHPRMGSLTTQSNKGTAKLGTTGYNAARTAMREITDGRGRNMGITPNLLVVGPSKEAEARKLLESEKLYEIAADKVQVLSDNPYRGTAELMVWNELSDTYAEYWYLFDTTKPIKPFIFQEVKAPDFQAFASMTDEHVFKNKEFLYGVDSIDNMGYALWQLAYMSDGTT